MNDPMEVQDDMNAKLARMNIKDLIAHRRALDARLEEARQQLQAQVEELDGTCSFHNGVAKKKGRPSKAKTDND